jgi:bifunctional DNA-binding transcriptional regulator/antitoxin component of YhaV-PrlF toxin-antitoxin module
MVVLGDVATITSKKMVTIPVRIMKKYGLRQGRKVRFEETEGGLLLVPVLSLRELQGAAKNHAKALIEGVGELEREHRAEAEKDAQKAGL